MLIWRPNCAGIFNLVPQTAGIYGNPRVDTLAVAILIELLYPVKFSIFAAHMGL